MRWFLAVINNCLYWATDEHNKRARAQTSVKRLNYFLIAITTIVTDCEYKERVDIHIRK